MENRQVNLLDLLDLVGGVLVLSHDGFLNNPQPSQGTVTVTFRSGKRVQVQATTGEYAEALKRLLNIK